MKSIRTLSLAAFALAFSASAAAQTYVRYSQNGGPVHWGMVHEDGIHQLSDAPYNTFTHTGVVVQENQVKLHAPVDPQLVFMTAFNFRSHISGEPAEYPGLFLVPASSIVGPQDPIVRPAESTNLHYEAEMAIIVGKRAENVSVEDAHEYIFGVTGGNDVSERDWQRDDIQWVRAKGSRGFNAVGPVLVQGADYKNIQITGRLNGEVVQGENSSDLIFGMEEMLSYISHHFTLEPGDMIWSGTMGSTRALQPGDVYEVELSGIGVLRNEVVQGK